MPPQTLGTLPRHFQGVRPPPYTTEGGGVREAGHPCLNGGAGGPQYHGVSKQKVWDRTVPVSAGGQRWNGKSLETYRVASFSGNCSRCPAAGGSVIVCMGPLVPTLLMEPTAPRKRGEMTTPPVAAYLRRLLKKSQMQGGARRAE